MEVAERIGIVQDRVDKSGENDTRKHILDTDKATARKIKVNIDNLLTKLPKSKIFPFKTVTAIRCAQSASASKVMAILRVRFVRIKSSQPP